jgi:hypothetical protein
MTSASSPYSPDPSPLPFSPHHFVPLPSPLTNARYAFHEHACNGYALGVTLHRLPYLHDPDPLWCCVISRGDTSPGMTRLALLLDSRELPLQMHCAWHKHAHWQNGRAQCHKAIKSLPSHTAAGNEGWAEQGEGGAVSLLHATGKLTTS